ncbi:hypothetical protein PUNSTDRAFT_60584 [Punctularia strigosozonata HHB-11173 SS5]|uniref:uncharacterized protein n=1 Tax=Punctularia strigosozonata (strain HHB-11173) TaxID=741275 RepID=UPI0004417024|nr:uncharacterized protein PUNSTDRAFT_60584 [Punctularia strigosozonata HHB-11173 SS5]EIN12883.1 hypothetical protein PUNSTDRAFT_60584 [Punctularia strigosozonata HHB-11173 SS5]
MPSLLNFADEIKLDHDNVRDLMQRFKAATAQDEKAAIANTMIREMAIHSDAEEISIYNEMGKHGMADVAKHNREEHASVKKLVYSADTTPITSDNYDQVLERAFVAFNTHAEEEERDEWPALLAKLSSEEIDAYAREFLKARAKAPPRPHPMAPQTGGIAQKAAALQATLHDKVVETLTSREFVDLKYKHPEI